ncbi:triose-phosphate isomerase [Roseivirga pacifica]|uniref:triose-phosphate isomerase n=1 Tax=Roseivirga pacifica TaxID=1267423 RepID=UPI0020942E4C|nr:triose-phosphate isomerase [Roseivirga pacifica]MCO6358950.1 triose-phosphate isomerase [Roseivirga pacifica]MCO6365414.1 triose-phosphate isomerase [Roseivirga pacifica]MCO6371856.1 triose-phosphate isomerase [Roseivirga pacifica]MCO6376033.1 triose-phosphate isomerase [Roseivirga pacifica]MCO6379234.1 triose-phosphate isomerase [Roseivirga pacifica]
MRKKVIAGNWKMNLTLEEGVSLASEVVNIAKDELASDVTMVMCTPAIHMAAVSKLTAEVANVHVGAQNISEHESGAYTGDISADMALSTGAEFVIIGHSERREYHFETNAQLAARVELALAKGLTPLFCCGESLETREAGDHVSFVTKQLEESLYQLSAEQMEKVVIAYEPIWAIGTGVTASTEQAQEMHKSIREALASKFGAEVAEQVSILYGGSMKPGNAPELLAQPDVDGGLIGGASLKSRDFIDIAKSY